MNIALIYKENDEVTIIGNSKELEALGHALIAKSKTGENLSVKLVSDNSNIPNIRIENYDEN